MKKLILLILSVCLAFCATGCASGNPARTPAESGENGGENGGGNGTDENVFTVKLSYHGEDYTPKTPVKAQWSSGSELYVADFVEGKATADGLDGDYTVTLSAAPDGLIYDPNGYTASNFRRETVIELHDIIKTYSGGTNLYEDIISIKELGVYRAVLTEPGQTVFYQYEPQASGFYTVSSWMDVTANEVNPILDVYVGNTQWKPKSPTRTIDDGGVCSTVTKNFVYDVKISDDEVGNIYSYGLRVNGRADKYPVYVDFQIKFESEYKRDDGVYEVRKAQHVPTQKTPDFPGKTFRYGYLDTGNVMDASKYVLAGDGYYHILNPDGSVSENLLYAKITSDCEIIVTQEGYDVMNPLNPINFMHGFTSPFLKLKIQGKDYTDFIMNGYGAYQKDASGNIIFKNGVTGALIPMWCNSDGVCPVNEELKEFLQDYALSQRFFNDGNGWAEGSPYNFNSSEDDQWLFACGYYI